MRIAVTGGSGKLDALPVEKARRVLGYRPQHSWR